MLVCFFFDVYAARPAYGKFDSDLAGRSARRCCVLADYRTVLKSPSAPYIDGVADSLAATDDLWRFWLSAQDVWYAGRAPPEVVKQRQQSRFDALVAYARRQSPFYARHFAGAPLRPTSLQLAPVTKHELMSGFDDWATDRDIRRQSVEAFVTDRSRIGQPYLGRYAVWTSSGTTGVPGIFVQDAHALAVYQSLMCTRFSETAPSLWQAIAGGERLALVAAVEGHFAGIVVWERMRRLYPWVGTHAKSFSALLPVDELVRGLNAFAPAFLSAYPTTLLILAEEQNRGRLSLGLRGIWSGGEALSESEREAVETAFQCRVANDYGASEAMSIAYDCGHGSLHVNSDWVMLEPVDEYQRPVPAGHAAASVLLTNLANATQPIIRYDLGDRVTFQRHPCTCGSVLPAIRVEGRRDDVLSFVTANGRRAHLAPLALCTAVEEGARTHRFQIIQIAPRSLVLRVEPASGEARRATWQRARNCLNDFLIRHGIQGVTIADDRKAVVCDAKSGKLHQVQAALRTARI